MWYWNILREDGGVNRVGRRRKGGQIEHVRVSIKKSEAEVYELALEAHELPKPTCPSLVVRARCDYTPLRSVQES